MRRTGLMGLVIAMGLGALGGEAAARSPKPAALTRYEPVKLDAVLEELRERDEAWDKARDDETAAIRKRQKEAAEDKRETRPVFVSSLPEGQYPTSLDQVHMVAHQPPWAQFNTGTCWSFASTSFLESEAERLTGHRVKLSEMATVYYEYLAKAARYVAERGDSAFSSGSEVNAVTRMWAQHGAVPLAAFRGYTGEDGRYDHTRLARELRGLLDYVKASDLWQWGTVEGLVRVILNAHLGTPPAEFEFEGRRWTPQAFAREELGFDEGAYINVMSTMKDPMWSWAEFEVPDNWWRDEGYLNVPLGDFYAGLKGAIEAGYSVAVAVDVSEPGRDGDHDVMFIPDFDIPGDRIDQRARELRLYSHSTTDDHGVHLVGWGEYAGHDWFLIKDSGRSARRGPLKGYYFMRDDYVKLKVLAYMVHRDAVPALLAKAPKRKIELKGEAKTKRKGKAKGHH